MTEPVIKGKKSRNHGVVRLKIRVRIGDGTRRFVDPVIGANGKLRPQQAFVGGKPEHHPEGIYALRYMRGGVRVYDTIGPDAHLALTAKLRVEHSLQAASLGLTSSDVGLTGISSQTRIDEAIESYLADTMAPKAKKTHYAYRITLTGFRASCANRKHLEEVTRRDILGYVSGLRIIGNCPQTISNGIDYLKIFFNRYNRAGRCCAEFPLCRTFILHRFRKTFATMHHEAGVPARTIQAWLRHSSLDTSLRYLASSDNTSERTRERVNSTFAGLLPPKASPEL